MTAPRTFSSPAGRADRATPSSSPSTRATYPAVTGEVLASDRRRRRRATPSPGASYARTWQAWPAVRNPGMARHVGPGGRRSPDAAASAGRRDCSSTACPALPGGRARPGGRGPRRGPAAPTGREHRLPLVLHYLGPRAGGDDRRVVRRAGRRGSRSRLDAGFDALVGILDWPDDADDADGEPARATPTTGRPRRSRSCARRFGEHVPGPAADAGVPARATVTKVTRRGAAHHGGGRGGRRRPRRLPLPRPGARCAGRGVSRHRRARLLQQAHPPSSTAATRQFTAPETTTAEPTSPAGNDHAKAPSDERPPRKGRSEGNAVAD